MGIPKLPDKFKCKPDEIHDSETKRLKSVKEKKQTFKAREKAVQDALKNLDLVRRNTKVVFDKDIDQDETKLKGRNTEKLELFDSDEEDSGHELDWDSKEFKAKLQKVNLKVLGSDERFKLDERFVEDESNLTTNECENKLNNEDENDLDKEKQQQLNILESILGAPVVPKNKDTKNKDLVKLRTKKGMIRYDPTENDHQEYEIKTEKSEPAVTKTKLKKQGDKEVIVNNAVPTVSKDIYFSVSKSLNESLIQKEQFSLLKTFGKETENNQDKVLNHKEPGTLKKFQFGLDTKNPFKYDSSDNEDDIGPESENKNINAEDVDAEHSEKLKGNIFGITDRFFFVADDSRFNEALKFFSKEFAPNEEFQNLRRKLKQIVRSKIRKSMQKTQPWGNKRKIKALNK